MRTIIIVALFAACGPLPTDPAPNLTPIDGQAAFALIAWRALGQQGAPPPVEWHREGCDKHPDAFMPTRGLVRCINGTYYLDEPYISAAVMPKPSLSAIAHEYQHFVDWQSGVDDWKHEGPAFQAGGAVERAEAAMRKAGF